MFRNRYVCFFCIVLVLSGCEKTKGSARNDSNAFQLDGLYISLDENTWDLEEVEISHESNVTEQFEKIGQATLFWHYELQREESDSPLLQIEHFNFSEWTYEEYWEQITEVIKNLDYCEILREEEFQIEENSAREFVYRSNDEYFYSVSIGCEKAEYSITLVTSNKERYEDYFEEIKNVVPTIWIEYF